MEKTVSIHVVVNVLTRHVIDSTEIVYVMANMVNMKVNRLKLNYDNICSVIIDKE